MRCNYCGAVLRKDAIGYRCPTENCDWEHGADEDVLTPDPKCITVDIHGDKHRPHEESSDIRLVDETTAEMAGRRNGANRGAT